MVSYKSGRRPPSLLYVKSTTQWGAMDAEVKVPSDVNTELKGSPLCNKSSVSQSVPLNPGVGQYIVMHATLTAKDFFLFNFYLSSPFTCIFSKTSLEFFLC